MSAILQCEKKTSWDICVILLDTLNFKLTRYNSESLWFIYEYYYIWILNAILDCTSSNSAFKRCAKTSSNAWNSTAELTDFENKEVFCFNGVFRLLHLGKSTKTSYSQWLFSPQMFRNRICDSPNHSWFQVSPPAIQSACTKHRQESQEI